MRTLKTVVFCLFFLAAASTVTWGQQASDNSGHNSAVATATIHEFLLEHARTLSATERAEKVAMVAKHHGPATSANPPAQQANLTVVLKPRDGGGCTVDLHGTSTTQFGAGSVLVRKISPNGSSGFLAGWEVTPDMVKQFGNWSIGSIRFQDGAISQGEDNGDYRIEFSVVTAGQVLVSGVTFPKGGCMGTPAPALPPEASVVDSVSGMIFIPGTFSYPVYIDGVVGDVSLVPGGITIRTSGQVNRPFYLTVASDTNNHTYYIQ